MAMTIDRKRVSGKSWGDVDKTALGNHVGDLFTRGGISKGQIQEIYAFVPDDAYDKSSDGQPIFHASKAKLPHHEIIGDSIVLNSSGLGAAAAALAGSRGGVDISTAEQAKVRSHLRKHYTQTDQELPEGLKESLAHVELARERPEPVPALPPGAKPLAEMVKGSLEYIASAIWEDFRDQCLPSPEMPTSAAQYGTCYFYIQDTFLDDKWIAVHSSDMDVDEYFKVPFTEADGEYTFAPRDQWELIELTYQPSTSPASDTDESKPPADGKPLAEAGGSAADMKHEIDAMSATDSRAMLQAMLKSQAAQDIAGGAYAETLTDSECKTTLKKLASDDGMCGKMAQLAIVERREASPEGSAPASAEGGASASVAAKPLKESLRKSIKAKGKRLDESIASAAIHLEESANGGEGSRRIRIDGILQADVVNGNHRRFKRAVVESMVGDLRAHLNESAGQGQLKVYRLTGEAEHPKDKGRKYAEYLSTIVGWDDIRFDGKSASVSGILVPTSQGKDAIILMESGIFPEGSVRGYYNSEFVIENGERIEEVIEGYITGIDLVKEGAFENTVEFAESLEEDMTLEQMQAALKEHPEWLPQGITAEQVKTMTGEALKTFEESLKGKLGLTPEADLGAHIKEFDEAKAAQKELFESKRVAAVAAAMAAETKDLKYGKLNDQFKQELADADIQDPLQVKPLAESLRKRYEAMLSAAKLQGMGFALDVPTAPVIEETKTGFEAQTGISEYLRPSWEFNERLIERGYIPRRDLSKPKTINEAFAAKVVKRFDEEYRGELMKEYIRFQEAKRIAQQFGKELGEAELVSDIALPYGVSRAVIAAVWPISIAVSVFDFGVTDQAPTRLYFERYAEDTTVTTVVAMGESATFTAFGSWLNLAHKALKRGTVVVKNSAEAITYVEGADYALDHFNGRIMALDGGDIGATDTVHVGYTYEAIRKGENASIERAKTQLDYVTLEIQADRLATQLTSEVVLFAKSQIGWDATTRTIANLIKEVQRKIDQNTLDKGLDTSMTLGAANIGGTWHTADPLDDLVACIGAARVLIQKRYYTPTAVVVSDTIMESLANWKGFTAAGKFPDSDLNADGFVGRVKALPAFHSVQFPDNWALVLTKELVGFRVYQPMAIKGPFPSYDNNGKLIAADQYYAEEYNGAESPIPGKGALVSIPS